ncbi:MAG: LLM class flavin-dependent oxidoreductase [Candidatus Devosia phytovorans]|uniref:LLM class flavin-dependent oxidoreductase n=1 Tax=Candidatus Devosia phytovorans TaxID=3121372 RepID=A0AAJ5VUA6_9HYPH|nr:MupA/Atu3671 family FMN-dependent luciferase-like monooxygenase [Devosia sp.]WEK03722.1 MAG: LLM class flavin-dependent oxidoreductase [Devosia sp.]
MLERGHAISALISKAPRNQDWAADKNIPVFNTLSELPERFSAGSFDWLLSIANLSIIADATLALPGQGTINFHDGLLPRFSGLNTPSWSLIEGSTEHGVTWHVVAGGIDEGDILAQQSFAIAPDETALTLNAKCLEAGMASFVEVVGQIENGALQGRTQDLSQRHYYAKNQRPDALATLDFTGSAEELSRLVRALSFGEGYRNPLVTPKVFALGRVFPVTALTISDIRSTTTPGTVVSITEGGVTVATADFDISLATGPAADGSQLVQVVGSGDTLGLAADESIALTAASQNAVAGETRHRTRIAKAMNVELPLIAESEAAGRTQSVALNLPTGTNTETIAAFFARLSAQENLSLAYANDQFAALGQKFSDYFSASVPLNLVAAPDTSAGDYIAMLGATIEKLRQDGPYLADLVARQPDLSEPKLDIGIMEGAVPALIASTAVTIAVGTNGATLVFDDRRMSATNARRLAGWLQTFASAAQDSSTTALKLMPILGADELQELLYTRNDTALDYDRTATVHSLIEQQVDRTPDAIAVARGSQALTYRQLDDAANKLAAALIARGVGAGTLVGLHLLRSVEMVISVLGIHKAGGAYVPLDPEFPADRISYMVEDSKALLVVTDRRHAGGLGLDSGKLVLIEDVLAGPAGERPGGRSAPGDLAYVIYTSGSTGRPKGVMVEHGNVANFFAGMDQRIAVNPEGDNVWLAVTSLSFDISVLELCWTLTRGFKVVLHVHHAAAAKSERGGLARPVEFGLYYWGNDDGVGPAKYELLLEGARIADQNGFSSLWTPERHFGAFGGPYPNPAVTGAAVAAITKNLSIRAGSCVLPLHHPARVAEEWAVIDNITNGRVAMAFASGWMPEDFVLRPENAPPNNKTAMIRDIDTVRRLWRGEKMKFSAGGMDVEVVTQPRPIQKELPIWVTSAGNPETFREAARQGANVLTHLLGQSVDELAEKIRAYRETLAELGRDPSQYKVTLMLHTLMGADREVVREQARQPMKDYLRSATALIKQYAWAFPAFKKPAGATQAMDVDLRTLNEEELDGILEYAFLRYFEDSGLFGTVEDGWARVQQVAGIGVDEVACLIDYGIPTQQVLEGLTTLSALVKDVGAAEIEQGEEGGLAAEVQQHKVTHLQCTPSMAMMFLSADEDKAALAAVRHLFIGGEALNASLVRQIGEATSASIENMYGPTETTIWSSTLSVPANVDGVVPIGTPIANTQLYVLDANQQPVPMGIPGELFIGGDGVTRGYYNRPDLTETRFFADPATGGRMYKTGDLVSVDPQSPQIKFIGRTDFQVKVRGYRIELGEIETAIGGFAGIKENVVLARKDDASDVRLVAYLRLTGVEFDEAALRAHLSATLAPYMVPSQFVVMQAFPLTPNAKVDRNKLPAPKAQALPAQPAAGNDEDTPPENDAQRTIAEAFKRTLGLQQIGLYDNFFALGGHSLLAVHVHRELKGSVAPDLAITDIFRYPTVAGLAQRIAQSGQPDVRLTGAAQRAAERRNAMANRLRPNGG